MEAISKDSVATLVGLAVAGLVLMRWAELIAAAPVGGTLLVAITLGLMYLVWRNGR